MAEHRAEGDVNPFAGRAVNWLLDFRAAMRPDHAFLIWEPFEGESQVFIPAEAGYGVSEVPLPDFR